jgi:hypothetical protein
MLNLDLASIDDKKIRDNFEEVGREFRDSPIIAGTWQFFEKSFPAAGSYKVFHKLGFTPKDVIQTFSSGAGTITYNYSSFTREYVDVTVAGGAISVRFLAGKVG